MPRHAQLNNIDHARLRVRTERAAALGDAVMVCPVYLHEVRDAQAHYPIVFRHDEASGVFQPVALFGLVREENLYLDAGRWDASYIPAAMRVQPFLIGRRPAPGADGQPQFEVHVDLDHPRVSETEGEPVFLEHGGMTELLKRAVTDLEGLNAAHPATKDFSAALARRDLLEPFTLNADLVDGSAQMLSGFHVIAEERVAELDSEGLSELHGAGHLQALFMAMASLSHLSALVARKNARLTRAGAP